MLGIIFEYVLFELAILINFDGSEYFAMVMLLGPWLDSGVLCAMWEQGMRGIGNQEGLDALDVCVAQGQPEVIGMVPIIAWDKFLSSSVAKVGITRYEDAACGMI